MYKFIIKTVIRSCIYVPVTMYSYSLFRDYTNIYFENSYEQRQLDQKIKQLLPLTPDKLNKILLESKNEELLCIEHIIRKNNKTFFNIANIDLLRDNNTRKHLEQQFSTYLSNLIK
jgi:hypothetical protein